ncbi:restriction endonuclease subunit S [Pseudarthrobacter sp. NPDC057230]|uniref:restriction endonuclease subunit S n=1 Tax=Pseudarthrobacter sp. NPDC057230 TaxID=3346057 RepID=UPI003632BBA3
MTIRRTIDDVCTQIVDCEHKTAPIDPNGEYFAVGTPAMRGNAINYAESRRISKDTFIKWTRRMLPKRGDLLFAREAPVGPIVLIPDTGNVAPGQRTMLLRPDPAQIDSRFLFYLLASPRQQELLLSKASGSTVAHLNVADVRAFELPVLPELGQQQAIAEILGALDDKIAANNRLVDSVAALVTLEFSRASRQAYQIVRLSELVSTQYGITTSAHGSPGPKFLRVTDINKKPWIEWDSTPNCTVSDMELNKYRVSPGDILVARMADPGKAAFIDAGDPEAVFASYLVRLKPHDPALALYLYYFLRSPQYLEYAEGAMTGSVQKNMNAKVIVATDVALPDSDLVLQFTETVQPLRKLIQSNLNENRSLNATRDTLLPQLMSGKLRVKDAEKVLEDAGV